MCFFHILSQQSPLSLSSMDSVEEVPNPEHVHVLEVLPPEDGETEGRRVEVAPFIGRFLLEHQVRVYLHMCERGY